jgi:hypothetical protein
MKKVVFIVICILGFVSIAACRSTSKSCGLADNNSQFDEISSDDSDEMMYV